jgi:copper transport protein
VYVLALVAASMFAPLPASAHAVLVGAAPASGTKLDAGPATITLRFDEVVETALGSVRVLDERGRDRAYGQPFHPSFDGSVVAVNVGALERGRYVVAWRVVSADSHLVSGAYSFGVRTDAGDVPAAIVEAGASSLSLLLIAGRFVLLSGLLTAVGTTLAARWLVPRSEAALPTSALELGAWLALAVGAFVEMSLQAEVAGGTLASAIATRFGVLRLVTTAAGFAGLIAVSARPRRWVVVVPAMTVAVFCVALSGHAGTSAHPWLSVPVDAVHLWLAALWIGVLATTLMAPHDVDARRTSRIATLAVAGIALSAIAQAIGTIAWPAALFTTPYGRLVCAKIALFALLLVLALRARRRVGLGTPAIGGEIRRELVALTAVVAVTAVLVEGNPPRHAEAGTETPPVAFSVRDVRVDVRGESLAAGRWRVFVTTRSHDSVRDADEVTATLGDPAAHVGPLPLAIRHTGQGVYVTDVFPPFPGPWRVTVRVRAGEFDENAADLTLQRP